MKVVALVVGGILAGCAPDIAPADRICSYLESLRQQDGAYAFPGQDASHLSATYAAVMTYAALGRDVPGDHAALAKVVAGPLYPVSADRDTARSRSHAQGIHEFRLQQIRVIKALGGDVAQFRGYASFKKPDSYTTSYELGGNPVMIQQMAALLIKEECGVGLTPEAHATYSTYLDERKRGNGSYNTTKASDGSDGHVVNTAYALVGRRVMGNKDDDGKIVAWIRDCQRADGGFSWAPNPPKGDVSDIWYAYAAVRALLDMGARPKNEQALCGWLLSLWNHDGGFAPRPGLRSDPMSTFRAVDLLVRLGWFGRLRKPSADIAARGKGKCDISSLHAFTIQFEAPGSGSVREAVQVSKELKIHLWGAKNAKPEWIAAAQAEADRCGVLVRFFRSDEAYGERRDIPGLGNFSHLRDPATPPNGARDTRPFQLWQMCDHECCARVWLDSGEYDGIGTFHFGCFDMTWILPFLYQYEETIPFVSNQDSHGETWWWRGELAAYRTVFLAKEGTWDGFREACGKGLVTSIREDAHTEGRLRMIGGSQEAKARIRALEREWRVGKVKSRVSVQVLTEKDVFEEAHPSKGRLIRVRVDFDWREFKGLVGSTCRLVSARQGGRELAIDRREFRHEKKDYLHGNLEEEYDLIPLLDGVDEAVVLHFEPVAGVDAKPFDVEVSPKTPHGLSASAGRQSE